MSDQGTPAAGWYPDPTGRHQHRYWDGAAWTGQVADDGATSDDPFVAPAPTQDQEAHPPPDASGHSHEPPAPAAAATATAAPEASSGGKAKSRLPILIGAFVVVALVVGGAIVLLSPSDEDDGAGDFTYTLSSEELTVHSVDLEVGDAVAWRIPNANNVLVGYGVEGDSLERMAGADEFSDLVTDVDDFVSDANEEAYAVLRDSSDLDEDLLDELSDAPDDELVALPGYDGYVISEVDYDQLGDDSDALSGAFIASVPIRLDLLMIAEDGQELIDLQVRVASPEDLGNVTELSSDDLDELYSDEFMSDFMDSVSKDFDLSDEIDLDSGSGDDEEASDDSAATTTEATTTTTEASLPPLSPEDEAACRYLFEQTEQEGAYDPSVVFPTMSDMATPGSEVQAAADAALADWQANGDLSSESIGDLLSACISVVGE